MALDAEITEAKTRFDKGIAALEHDFRGIRTGRATTAIVDGVRVDAYGSLMPLSQCASVSVPDATTIMIKPWDKGLLKAIERALTEAALGMNPQNDGQVIRMILPPLSTERRKQLAGQAKEACEKHKVVMRNVRRDILKGIENRAKADKLPEDVVKKTGEKVTEMLKAAEDKAEKLLAEKTKDIMTL
jgi:ribosome recycling factor